MEDALGRGKPLALTRGRWKRSWFLEVRLGMIISGARGARQGASEASAANLARGRQSRGTGAPPGVVLGPAQKWGPGL